MVPQPIVRTALHTQWPAASVARLVDPAWDAARDDWISAFSERFLALRPHEDEEPIHALAADLWPDVGGHDPVIAAEMEHEATFGS